MRALQFVIETVSNLFIYILIVRLVLPFIRANFRNPIVQGILGITSPIVVPLRRVLPSIGKIDTATIVVAYAVKYLALLLILAAAGGAALAEPLAIAWYALIELIVTIFRLFSVAILVRIILGWVAPNQYNPVTEIIGAMTEPLLAPARRIIPPMGTIDFSPMFVMIAIYAASILVEDLGALLF